MEKAPASKNFPGPLETARLSDQDLKDRADFEYLLAIMEAQGASGITQPVDYQDALAYKNKKESFLKTEAPEGSVAELYDHVIFDFDGVLYDSTYLAYKATEITLEKLGKKGIPVPPSVEAIANTYSSPHDVYYKRYGITFDTPEKLAEFQKEYREVARQVNEEHHTPAALYPEVREILDTLREAKKTNPKLKIHIISAGAEKYVRDVLEENSILVDFDQIHTETTNKAAMIKKISQEDGESDPGRTVMIGDLPSDIKDAQSEGVHTIAVARGEREEERLGMYLPEYVVTDLSGLLHLTSYSKELRQKEFDKENPFTSPKIAREWSSSVENEEDHWRDKELYPSMQSWLESFNDGNAVIADIGAGQGRSSTELHGYKKYIGIEPSPFLVNRAKELYAAPERNFVKGNAYEIPLSNESIDGALSVNVWFHIKDTDKATAELARILKPGGAFFICTADNDSLDAWKELYVDPKIDEEKMEGEVKVPVNNMSLNTFYFQPNTKVIETLTRYGLNVDSVTKTCGKEGATLFILIQGKKNGNE